MYLQLLITDPNLSIGRRRRRTRGRSAARALLLLFLIFVFVFLLFLALLLFFFVAFLISATTRFELTCWGRCRGVSSGGHRGSSSRRENRDGDRCQRGSIVNFTFLFLFFELRKRLDASLRFSVKSWVPCRSQWWGISLRSHASGQLLMPK